MADPTRQAQFDVFLSHNSKDKPAVIALAKQLKANGIKVWLDAWELRPGQPWQEALEEIIETCGSAAILVGADGIGPWEDMEMRACLAQFVRRKLPVIPVLLPDCPEQPHVPLFLQGLTWVDCRGGRDEEGFHRLLWGITGVKPTHFHGDKPEPPPLNETHPPKVAPEPPPKPIINVTPRWRHWLPWLMAALVMGLVLADLSLRWGKNVKEQTPAANPSPSSQSSKEFIEPEMVILDGGVFWMGSDKQTDPLASDNEKPRHQVTVKPFSIGQYEVTVGEYAAFVKATHRPSRGCWVYSGGTLNQDATKSWNDPGFKQIDLNPVVCVSYADAQAYAEWLKEKTGKPYRLPTEAEWEFAARAGTDTPWSWPAGESAINAYAWYAGNAGSSTHPRGEKKPNARGLYDTAGNAWEWVEDAWHDNYQGAPTDGSAWVDGNSADRVLRGGSWYHSGRYVRSAFRDGDEPDHRSRIIGFRLALGQPNP